MFTFVNMKAKTRIESSELVRISTKAIRKAKKYKKRTGVPIGKVFENAMLAYDYKETSLMETFLKEPLK